jgi:ABC-type uncharacterized transport system substrate-binding protein
MLVPTAMRLSLAVYLVLLIVIFAFSDCAAAQQSNTYRIGFLTPASSASMEARVERFRHGLRELGYVEGQNTVIEYRWATGRSNDCPTLRSS